MSADCIAVSPGTSGLLHPRIPLSLGAPPAPTSGLVPLVWEARLIFVLFHPGVDDREFGIRNARYSTCHDCDDGPAELRHYCHDWAYNARCPGLLTLWRKCELQRSALWRRHEAQDDAAAGRPAGDRLARGIVGAVEDDLIGDGSPDSIDLRLIVAVALARGDRAAIGNGAAWRVRLRLREVVEPGRELRIGVWRWRRLRWLCQADDEHADRDDVSAHGGRSVMRCSMMLAQRSGQCAEEMLTIARARR